MIQGKIFRMSTVEFMDLVNIPRHSGIQAQIHLEPDLTNEEFATLLDPEVTASYIPENIRPKHLNFISRTWFYILSNSLIPLSTASEESNLYPETRHAIMKLTHGLLFDFEDCFIRNLVHAAELPFTLKPYAPWLQIVYDYGRNEDFVARHHPKIFLPPVRNTLELLRKPNDPFATYVGVRHEVNERNLSKKFQKDCHHFELIFDRNNCSKTSLKQISARCNVSLMRSTELATLRSITISICVSSNVIPGRDSGNSTQ